MNKIVQLYIFHCKNNRKVMKKKFKTAENKKEPIPCTLFLLTIEICA